VAGDLILIPTDAAVAGGNGPVVCNGALLSGQLVAHPEWHLAVAGGDGPQLVFWPNGYSGLIADDGIELLDADGGVVARTGDHIEAGGGMTMIDGRDGFGVCPVGIEVVPGAP